jgi:hypothetical protein
VGLRERLEDRVAQALGAAGPQASALGRSGRVEGLAGDGIGQGADCPPVIDRDLGALGVQIVKIRASSPT